MESVYIGRFPPVPGGVFLGAAETFSVNFFILHETISCAHVLYLATLFPLICHLSVMFSK